MKRETKNWEQVKIVDWRNLPFEKDNVTESKLLKYLFTEFNRMIFDEQHELGKKDLLKENIFHNSEKIIAIDLSNLETNQASELNSFTYLLHEHPFFLINCFLPNRALYNTELHEHLSKKRYILPIMNQIIPYDNYWGKLKYGSEFIELIKGTIEKIDLDSFPNVNEHRFKENLLNHFPDITINGKEILHNQKIIWLGVNEKINQTLNFLYNNNIETFSLDNLENLQETDKVELEEYTKTSMLFEVNGCKIKFRFLKRNILPKLMINLVNQFHFYSSEKDVLQVTEKKERITNRTKINSLEYHKISEIFNNPSYALKLVSYIYNIVKCDNIEQIIIAFDDYNNIQIEKTFGAYYRDANVCRIVNFLGEPVTYPFNKLKKKARTIIITV